MRAFQCGQDALPLRQLVEAVHRLDVIDIGIFRAAEIAQQAVLRTDGGIVETGTDGMRQGNLPVAVLQHIGFGALKDADFVLRETRRMHAALDPEAAGLHADQPHALVLDERMEQADRVAPAADTGQQCGRQSPFRLENLFACFAADHALEVADHHRIRVRAERRTEDIVRRADIRHPVAHRFVDGFLERLLADGYRHYRGAEAFHAENIQCLTLHVHLAHVDDTLEAEHRADRGRGHTVLAGARLGDDALLSHAFGEQNLPHGIINLVCARVAEVLALEVDFCRAELFGHAFRIIERRRAADIFAQVILQLLPEFRILPHRMVNTRQFVQRLHQRFRNKHSSIRSKMSVSVGLSRFHSKIL